MNAKVGSLIIAIGLLSACSGGDYTVVVKRTSERDYQEAMALYRSMIEKNPKPLYLNNLAVVTFRYAEPEKALQLLDRAAEHAGWMLKNAIATNRRMILAYRDARETICNTLHKKNSVATLSNVKTLSIEFKYSADDVGYYIVAQCFEKNGDNDSAKIAYENLHKLFKDTPIESKYMQAGSHLTQPSAP